MTRRTRNTPEMEEAGREENERRRYEAEQEEAMSETKHTPGPWSRSWVYGAIRHINKNVDSDAFWQPDDGEDPDTANCPNVRSFPADADLIAAAPDLLDALRQAVSVLGEDGLVECFCRGNFVCSGCRAREASQAAIAKAEGRS